MKVYSVISNQKRVGIIVAGSKRIAARKLNKRIGQRIYPPNSKLVDGRMVIF